MSFVRWHMPVNMHVHYGLPTVPALQVCIYANMQLQLVLWTCFGNVLMPYRFEHWTRDKYGLLDMVYFRVPFQQALAGLRLGIYISVAANAESASCYTGEVHHFNIRSTGNYQFRINSHQYHHRRYLAGEHIDPLCIPFMLHDMERTSCRQQSIIYKEYISIAQCLFTEHFQMLRTVWMQQVQTTNELNHCYGGAYV